MGANPIGCERVRKIRALAQLLVALFFSAFFMYFIFSFSTVFFLGGSREGEKRIKSEKTKTIFFSVGGRRFLSKQGAKRTI